MCLIFIPIARASEHLQRVCKARTLRGGPESGRNTPQADLFTLPHVAGLVAANATKSGVSWRKPHAPTL